jgi:large subunit ribosomal protein L21
MFAVIKTGGKQYKVAAEDEIVVMTLPGDAGTEITFDQVLSYSDGTTLDVGAPLVAGATVAATIVAQKRGPKVIAFKKRRRQNSKRKRGHRQDLTVVRITDILLAGQERRRHGAGSAEATVAGGSAADVSVADVSATHAPEAALAEAGAA